MDKYFDDCYECINLHGGECSKGQWYKDLLLSGIREELGLEEDDDVFCPDYKAHKYNPDWLEHDESIRRSEDK